MLRDLFSLFPAYAGVIQLPSFVTYCSNTFPRIRGGDPLLANLAGDDTAFSPHTRG